jgi:sialidase-1
MCHQQHTGRKVGLGTANIKAKYHMKSLSFIMTICLIFPMNVKGQEKHFNYIFRQGQDGYAVFRIPAIIKAKNGTLLAFAEGRKNSGSDTGDIDLVMKSSTNDGKTWSPLKVVWDDGDNVCGNPAPVVEQESGIVYLLLTWNLGSDHERDIIDQKSKDTRRVFITQSDDHGNSWTKPKEITSSTKKDDWTWYATGPVHGIQLSKNEQYKGRMVIPCDHIEAETRHYYSHVIYSDDKGKTWQLGGSTPQHQVNECSIAELDNGDLLLNMRNYDRDSKTRRTALSTDGGITWSDLKNDTALIEPICQGSLLGNDQKGSKTLYFSNPASEKSRENMTLKYSDDDGVSWSKAFVVHRGPSAYSDIVRVSKHTIGILYEGGIKSPYEGISIEIVELSALK